jgi:aminopeptidase
MDKRWQALGEVLVHHSTNVQPGDRVMIAMVEVETYPLAHAVYEATIKAGGYPQIQLLSESLRHSVLKFGTPDQHSWVPEIEAYGMEWADVYIGLRGAHNLYELSDVDTEALAVNQAVMGKISTMRWQKTRWCLVRVPNQAFAQQAETTYETLEDMFFNACLMDYESASKRWHEQASKLDGGHQVQVVGRETDLSFSTEGRKWLVFDGRINMPDGEIYTAPVNKTINGKIYFEFPGVLGGKLMHDIRLEWRDGTLIHASSSTNEDYLHHIIGTDAGSSLLGEFALGMNPYVDRFCKDILIDEKIGGTIHIALGRAYPACGGVNKSSIHWDIVKDLRQEGAVYLDNKPVLRGGEVII